MYRIWTKKDPPYREDAVVAFIYWECTKYPADVGEKIKGNFSFYILYIW
jgi:hypothetical protein